MKLTVLFIAISFLGWQYFTITNTLANRLQQRTNQIDSYFLLAKSRNKEIAENIDDFMFMYKKENELFFKNVNSRKYVTVIY